MTDTERKVMEILIKHPPTTDAWKDPIQAVEKGTGWVNPDFVKSMLQRNLLKIATGPRNIADPSDVKNNLLWWEKGTEAD